jgi:hypothetical protein
MKLSKEQIAKIDETLVLNGVVYEDIKLELIDHIASEIEDKIQNEGVYFDLALKNSFYERRNILKTSSAPYWLGNFFNAPKIVIDKCVSNTQDLAKSTYFSAVIASFILTGFYQIYHGEKIIRISDNIIQAFFIFFSLSTLTLYFVALNSKIKTTYSRLFIRRGWSMAIFLLMISFGEMQIHFYRPNMSVFIIAIGNTCYMTLFSYTLLNMNLVVKHFKTLKKYNLYN